MQRVNQNIHLSLKSEIDFWAVLLNELMYYFVLQLTRKSYTPCLKF